MLMLNISLYEKIASTILHPGALLGSVHESVKQDLWNDFQEIKAVNREDNSTVKCHAPKLLKEMDTPQTTKEM